MPTIIDHSRSGRLFYLRDLHGAGMACRSAVPGPAADQRRAFHLETGASQQRYVLRFVLPIAGCLRHHPRIVDQCQPGRQPDSVRRGGPRRAHRLGIRTQTTSKTRRRRGFGKPITPWKTVNSKPPKAWR